MTRRLRHESGSDVDLDAFARRVASPLQPAERAHPTLLTRVMSEVRHEGSLDVSHRVTPWWRRSISVRVTPVGGLALAAGLAAVVAGAYLLPSPERSFQPPLVAAQTDTVHVVRFVFVAPGVSSVAIVGDFNRWDMSAHRLMRANDPGTWTISLPMPAGRHEYAFVVDGTHWVTDPAASRAIVDEFGGESSVITVGASDGTRSG